MKRKENARFPIGLQNGWKRKHWQSWKSSVFKLVFDIRNPNLLFTSVDQVISLPTFYLFLQSWPVMIYIHSIDICIERISHHMHCSHHPYIRSIVSPQTERDTRLPFISGSHLQMSKASNWSISQNIQLCIYLTMYF